MTVWQSLRARLGSQRLARALRFYPPYLGAGVRVIEVDAAWRNIEVELKLTRWNQNFVGTQFGGSLYAMCDPFYVLMLIENLGPGHVVWDKAARIEFLRPGRSAVRARFELTSEALERIRGELAAQGKSHPEFEVLVRDTEQQLIARVTKLLSIRRQVGAEAAR